LKTATFALVALFTACAHDRTHAPALRPAPATTSRAGSSPDAPVEETSLRFVENDYVGALAQARTRHVPLFVDAWAPWCHTCLSMRAFVFPDPGLRPLWKRFVWLSLDTERDENAAVVARLAPSVLPTLYVIDPASERVTLAWPGSLTASELLTLLGDAAIGAGPDGPLAVDAQVARLSEEKRLPECVTAGADAAPRMPPGSAVADVVRAAIGCAEDLAKDAPERARLPELAELGERIASDRAQPILADDRSDLYDYVVFAWQELGRKDDARRLALAWATFLEGEAAAAPNPAARAVFDAHRLRAYLALDEPEKAVPMLEQSERDFPGDYNPPARLAAALMALKRTDEALAASQRALGRAYGPRRLNLWSLQADILVARGDRRGAADALRAALAYGASASLTRSYPKQLESLRRRLAGLDGGPDATPVDGAPPRK